MIFEDLSTRITDANFSEFGYKRFAVFDLEQFIRMREWKQPHILPEVKNTLREAINFLKNAQRGNTIFQETSKNKTLSTDLRALEAYDIAITAYENSNINEYTFEKFLGLSIVLLKTMLDAEKLKEFTFSPELEQNLANYIRELGKVMYSDSLPQSGEELP